MLKGFNKVVAKLIDIVATVGTVSQITPLFLNNNSNVCEILTRCSKITSGYPVKVFDR